MSDPPVVIDVPPSEEPPPTPIQYFTIECPDCGVGWKIVTTPTEPTPCPACQARRETEP